MGASAALSAKAKEAQQLAAAAGKSLGTLGHKLVHGTSELFDQIKDAIQNEMAFDEPGAGGSSRRMPSRRQLAAGSGTAKYSRWGLGWAGLGRTAAHVGGPPALFAGQCQRMDAVQRVQNCHRTGSAAQPH